MSRNISDRYAGRGQRYENDSSSRDSDSGRRRAASDAPVRGLPSQYDRRQRADSDSAEYDERRGDLLRGARSRYTEGSSSSSSNSSSNRYADARERPSGERRNRYEVGAMPDDDESVDIETRMANLSRATREKSRNALRMLNESEETAFKTNDNLVQQTEKLNRAQVEAARANVNVQKSKHELRQLEKYGKMIAISVPTIFSSERRKEARDRSEADRQLQRSEAQFSPISPESSRMSPSRAEHNQKRVERERNGLYDQNELEEDLGEISESVSRLKAMALSLGETVDYNNKQIDRLHSSSDHVSSSLNEASRSAKRYHK